MNKTLRQVVALAEQRNTIGYSSTSSNKRQALSQDSEYVATDISRLNDLVTKLGQLHPRPITTVGELLLLSEPQVMDALDIGLNDAKILLDFVSQLICPPIHSAASIAKLYGAIPTLIPGLDDSLRGGIRSGLITELVGRAGAGKTQFCITLSALVAATGKGVLYIDSENRFQPSRLAEILQSRTRNYSLQWDTIAGRIDIVKPTSAIQVLEVLESAETRLIKRNVALVVLDSIAVLARHDYDAKRELIARQQMLSRQASQMKYLAETFHIPIVVTNQVSGGRQQSTLGFDADVHPALGNTWSHCVNVRLVLGATKNGSIRRRVTIAKSPFCNSMSYGYEITSSGVVPREMKDDEVDDTEQFLRSMAPEELEGIFDD